MPPLRDEEFFTVAEVASMAKVTTKTVRNWSRSGLLEASRFGGRVRISRTQLLLFMKSKF